MIENLKRAMYLPRGSSHFIVTSFVNGRGTLLSKVELDKNSEQMAEMIIYDCFQNFYTIIEADN